MARLRARGCTPKFTKNFRLVLSTNGIWRGDLRDMSYCSGPGCPTCASTATQSKSAPTDELKKVNGHCGKALGLKSDSNGADVVLLCNRLARHKGAHRGRYGDEVLRWR